MRLVGENFAEVEATAEIIRKMIYDDASRGNFMILSRCADDFVQIAYENDGFVVEYHNNGNHFTCSPCIVTRESAELIFLNEIEGRTEWRKEYVWKKLKVKNACRINIRFPVKVRLYWLLAGFIIAYIGNVAYLWRQYGPPTGFCTKCLIYWGRHKVLPGDIHHVEHTPLQWALFGNDNADFDNKYSE